MAVKRQRRHVRALGTTAGGPGPPRKSLLDRYLPHFEVAIRQRVILPASPGETYGWLRRFDWAQHAGAVAVALKEIRSVPRFIADVAHQARNLPFGARFIVDDALRVGFVLLEEKPGRHLVLGAAGKLWKPAFELLELSRADFAEFHDAKYVKLVVGFLAVPYGKERTLLRHESRLLSTDATARAHLKRWWRAAEPYVDLFMRRALKTIVSVAKEQRREAAVPPWRQDR